MGTVILSICGIPGAGKSSVIRAAVEALPGSDRIQSFEEYSEVSDFPRDFARWMADGADPNAWRSELLIEHLNAVRASQPFLSTWKDRTIAPTSALFIEDQFGRQRAALAPYFDAVVFVQIPFEIALARRLIRDINRGALKDDPRKARDHVEKHCNAYLAYFRKLCKLTSTYLSEHADLIIDGELEIGAKRDLLLDFVRKLQRKRTCSIHSDTLDRASDCWGI